MITVATTQKPIKYSGSKPSGRCRKSFSCARHRRGMLVGRPSRSCARQASCLQYTATALSLLCIICLNHCVVTPTTIPTIALLHPQRSRWMAQISTDWNAADCRQITSDPATRVLYDSEEVSSSRHGVGWGNVNLTSECLVEAGYVAKQNIVSSSITFKASVSADCDAPNLTVLQNPADFSHDSREKLFHALSRHLNNLNTHEPLQIAAV